MTLQHPARMRVLSLFRVVLPLAIASRSQAQSRDQAILSDPDTACHNAVRISLNQPVLYHQHQIQSSRLLVPCPEILPSHPNIPCPYPRLGPRTRPRELLFRNSTKGDNSRLLAHPTLCSRRLDCYQYSKRVWLSFCSKEWRSWSKYGNE